MTTINQLDLKKIKDIEGTDEIQRLIEIIAILNTETFISYIDIYNKLELESEKFITKFSEFLRVECQNKSLPIFQEFLLDSKINIVNSLINRKETV